jgi:prepilin-type N-terminal cleavage/methylation domain-containing protein
MTRAIRRGFTLLEVMVALTIGGLVLLGARSLLEAVSDVAGQLTASTRAVDAVANADRLLHTLFARLEVGTPWARPFGGDDRTVRFTTWCDTSAGTLVPCDAAVGFDHQADSTALIVCLTPVSPRASIGPGTVVLRRGIRSGTLRYVNTPAAGGQWFWRWGDAVVAPVAAAVIIDGDTTIVRIGARG